MAQVMLHNTPTFYVEYVKNWLAHEQKEKKHPAQLLIVQDILTLIEVAASVMTPQQAEPAEQTKQNSDESARHESIEG